MTVKPVLRGTSLGGNRSRFQCHHARLARTNVTQMRTVAAAADRRGAGTSGGCPVVSALSTVGLVARVTEYVRPGTLDEALACLGRPGAVLIGGGTKVNAEPSAEPVAVVDLQALPIGGIEPGEAGVLVIGATVTLQRMADADAVPAAIAEAARREAPSTLRNMATAGGCVATADPSSELLASLLVHEARVGLAGPDGARDAGLADVLADRRELAGRIIVALSVRTGGVTSVARTGRTSADRPIVAAVARRTADGRRLLALTGVAATPVLVAASPEAVAGLDPPGDFRGSAEYRRALAAVLSRRALDEVG